MTVSYTHLDVYKRQFINLRIESKRKRPCITATRQSRVITTIVYPDSIDSALRRFFRSCLLSNEFTPFITC